LAQTKQEKSFAFLCARNALHFWACLIPRFSKQTVFACHYCCCL